MELVYIIIGIIVGVIFGILFMKSKSGALSVKYEMLSQELDNSKTENAKLSTKLSSLTEETNTIIKERNNLSFERNTVKNLYEKAIADAERLKIEEENKARERESQARLAFERQIAELKSQHEHSIANLKSEYASQKQEILEQHATAMISLREESAKSIREQKAQYEQAIASLKEEFEKQRNEMKEQHRKALEDKDAACQSAMNAQERRHQEAVQAMQTRFNETMDKVTAQVKNATADMLKERQKEFAEKSNQDLGQIVNPLRETIDKMKKAMDDNTLKQTEMSSEMKVNIAYMMRQSQAAKESADELTRVFKHGSKVQGDWGETVLDELLLAQGLTKGIHYDTQTVIKDASGNTIRSEEGAMMRPDVILHLDQRRELIIDAKVSLTAFMDYVNAENEDERQRFLKAHIASLQKHVDELSKKDYSSYIQVPKVKMDYVIMFVPHTGALWTALNAQPDLWRKAMERNVFIADEQTLFAALRIINLTWTQIVQAQNHERVFELANEMLNRVGQFWSEYEAMGKALRSAQAAFEKGKAKITEGGQSINTTANKLIKLGARQSDRNPLPQLLDIDEIPSLERSSISSKDMADHS